jgi:hypothetical protein
VTDRTLQGMARVRCNPAVAATIDLRLIVTASAVQLYPAHEADARFLESDRSCWKAGLRSAGLTNACGRRPSAPLRKVIESPVQCGGQPGCRVFLRHISIMRLLSLGYEPTDVRLRCLGQSLVTVLTSTDLLAEVLWRLLCLPRLSLSQRVWFTNRFTEVVLDLLGEHLIRRSGQVIQDRPSPVMGWAGIPELSTCVGRRPMAWLQSPLETALILDRLLLIGVVRCCSQLLAVAVSSRDPVVSMVQAAGARRVPRSTLDSSRLPYRSRRACQAASFSGRIRCLLYRSCT